MTPEPVFMATSARANITPHGTWTLGGYAARNTKSTGVHAPLEANVLALENPTTGSSMVWVCIDVLAITPELRRTLVAAVRSVIPVPADRVIVVGSHTHSAPDAWTGTIHPGLPARFDPVEGERIAESLTDALRHAGPARPVSLFWGIADVVGVGASRHDADKVSDTSIGVLNVRAPEISAIVFDYACHATVLGSSSAVLSPDWIGGARAELRRRFGSDLPVLYLPGSAGDISTRFTRQAQTPEEADRLGQIVGAAASTVIDEGIPLTGSGIEVRRRRFEAHVRTSFGDIESDGDSLGDEPDASGRVEQSRREGQHSRAAFEASTFPSTVKIETTTVRLGDRRWLHTPFEMNSALGRKVTANDTELRHVGYSDGYAGYLVDTATAREGHYEALASLFDLTETQTILDELRAGAE